MARLSQGLIEGLTQPGFQQGLFNLGTQVADRRRVLEEEKRKDELNKGMLSQGLVLSRAADAGQLTQKQQDLYAQAAVAAGVDPATIVQTIQTAQARSQNVANTNVLKGEFSTWAAQNSINENIRKDIVRGLTAGTIKSYQDAIDRANTNSQKMAKDSYYSNLSTYDSRLAGLIDRGEFDKADALMDKLKREQETAPARETLNDFQNTGIITPDNRKQIWDAVVATSDNLDAAITTMNKIEDQSIQLRAEQHKGRTRKIDYIPKQKEGAVTPLFGGAGSGDVRTLTIEAPLNEKGEIDPKWLADFKEFSAERIIGEGDSLAPKKGSNQESTESKPEQKPKQTPRGLAEQSMGLSNTESTVLGPVGFTQ
jgi:hypothetical protein